MASVELPRKFLHDDGGQIEHEEEEAVRPGGRAGQPGHVPLGAPLHRRHDKARLADQLHEPRQPRVGSASDSQHSHGKKRLGQKLGKDSEHGLATETRSTISLLALFFR